MNIQHLVIKHAASPSNPPKGYGLELGLKVGKYRGDRTRELQSQGMGLAAARDQAQKEITAKWGNPV